MRERWGLKKLSKEERRREMRGDVWMNYSMKSTRRSDWVTMKNYRLPSWSASVSPAGVPLLPKKILCYQSPVFIVIENSYRNLIRIRKTVDTC